LFIRHPKLLAAQMLIEKKLIPLLDVYAKSSLYKQAVRHSLFATEVALDWQ
jgi:hypothetical protein